jgi:glycosyltransferase involved in cell wall biosynthesis
MTSKETHLHPNQSIPEMTKNLSWGEEPSNTQRDPRGLQKEQHVGAALVSVVIPCYNQAHFLGEAIESVLAQSYPHFEIVVVDDGSTDDTSEVAARYQAVRLVRQENQGLAAARNSGIRESEGGYLVFLDADDRLLPGALEVGVEHLNAHPECAFVFGRCRFVTSDGSPLWESQLSRAIEGDHYVELLQGNYISNPATVIYRRSVFESVGDFDTSISPAADYELYYRIARNFPIYCHDAVVTEYRRHGANMTHNSMLMLKSNVAALRLQRAYVKRDRRYKEAYKAGVRFWQATYGGSLAREVLAHVWRREWKQAIGDLLVLLRYDPRVFIRAWQKLRRSVHLHR